MPHVHLRSQRDHPHRATDRQSAHEKGCGRVGRRRFVEGQGGNQHRLSEMLPSARKLFPDANPLSRRTDDHVLPLPEVRSSMEGKLKPRLTKLKLTQMSHLRMLLFVLLAACMFMMLACSATAFEVVPNNTFHYFSRAHALTRAASSSTKSSSTTEPPFIFVVFLCIWKRPLLTHFVVDHFVHLAHSAARDHIRIDLFLVGSDEAETSSLAMSARAEVTIPATSPYFTRIAYVIHPNRPVGAKHQLGLESLRAHYLSRTGPGVKLPDAVAVFGSDDVVTGSFFTHARNALAGGGMTHVFGLRDVWFYQLQSRQLIYTAGYTSSRTPLANTVGCGRVLSWALLDAIRWRVWDKQRDRGLDQSAVRHVMNRFAFVPEVSIDVEGRPLGILAVDVKTDAFAKQGTNVWHFDSIVKAAADGKGRLQRYMNESADETFRKAFGTRFWERLDLLRSRMMRAEEETSL